MQKKRKGQELPAKARPGLAAREQKILNLLQENPTGMTLAELAYGLDIPSAAVSKTLQHMASQGQIRKEQSLYLPPKA
jgi:DNA-binding IclR family transcriptional regulator